MHLQYIASQMITEQTYNTLRRALQYCIELFNMLRFLFRMPPLISDYFAAQRGNVASAMYSSFPFMYFGLVFK